MLEWESGSIWFVLKDFVFGNEHWVCHRAQVILIDASICTPRHLIYIQLVSHKQWFSGCCNTGGKKDVKTFGECLHFLPNSAWFLSEECRDTFHRPRRLGHHAKCWNVCLGETDWHWWYTRVDQNKPSGATFYLCMGVCSMRTPVSPNTFLQPIPLPHTKIWIPRWSA